MTIRDYMYEHLNQLTGARLTYSFVRIGGLATDVSPEWLDRLEEILCFYEKWIRRVHGLMDRNRIFLDRTRDVGVISTADAIHWGFTGPMLRSTGKPMDLRKCTPYLAYGDLDFEVPVGIKGDNYDRYYVRMREMDQSVSMIRQCVKKLPPGEVNVKGHMFMLPEKKKVYSEIESLINHFKVIMEGPRVPPGEVYSAHEAANGELGFYIVSQGTEFHPHRRPSQADRGVSASGYHPHLRIDQHGGRGM
jgi:NADH-quinone oxidoreductase subunit D